LNFDALSQQSQSWSQSPPRQFAEQRIFCRLRSDLIHRQNSVICSRDAHPTPLDQIRSEKALQELSLTETSLSIRGCITHAGQDPGLITTGRWAYVRMIYN